MAETKLFHLGDVLSVTHERLVSPRHIEGVYDILGWMTGDQLYTHQLPRAGRTCKPALLAQFPELNAPEIQSSLDAMLIELEPLQTKESRMVVINRWLDEQAKVYGEMLAVAPLTNGDYVTIDPLIELESMVGKEKVIVVEP